MSLDRIVKSMSSGILSAVSLLFLVSYTPYESPKPINLERIPVVASPEPEVEFHRKKREILFIGTAVPYNNPENVSEDTPKWIAFRSIYRWDNMLTEIERVYDMPEGLLAGIVWVESWGNPIAINKISGAAGLAQLMSGTAEALGLRVLNNTGFAKNQAHANELIALTRTSNCNYRILDSQPNCDYEELMELDQRFDPLRNLDAAAMYLAQEFGKFRRIGYGERQAWDKARAVFLQGNPDPTAVSIKYVEAAIKNQRSYVELKRRLGLLQPREQNYLPLVRSMALPIIR